MLVVSWSVCVFAFQVTVHSCFLSPYYSPALILAFLSSFFPPISFYTSYCFTVLLSALLLFVKLSFSLVSCCITVVPCTLLPLSHVCHSLDSVTIQQLCPDFSEALREFQNTVFTRTNTKSIPTQCKHSTQAVLQFCQ